mgnify:CR=1 FL=1
MTPNEQDLVEILTAATEAKNFIISEAPEAAHQLLAWRFYTSLIAFSVCAVAMVVLIVLAVWFTRRRQATLERLQQAFDEGELWTRHRGRGSTTSEELDMRRDWATVAPIVLMFAAMIPFILMCKFSAWIKILIAPKLYLVECVSSLIN